MQSTIANALSATLHTHLYPSSTITFSLHVLSQDGSLLAALLNASTLAAVAAPLFAALPFAGGLGRAGSFSLFVNPTMQLVWAGLSAAAVLCLAAGSRSAQAAPRERPARREKETPKTVEVAPAAPAPARPGAASALRWDDDF